MAKSVLDGTEWTATEFAGLLPEEQRTNRPELVCLACDGRAVFRAGQSRQPSFAARHRQDCRLVSRPWSAFKFLAAAGQGSQLYSAGVQSPAVSPPA
ncbi:competence protein CoiA family protein [Paenarthrobacter sp. NPDC057981]|uniref:competence protein CoiA family protein n=1 Tax=Paenarthrobacter sp. NPDC057981 TaxID=3346297 RepID=UPI0036DE7BC3